MSAPRMAVFLSATARYLRTIQCDGSMSKRCHDLLVHSVAPISRMCNVWMLARRGCAEQRPCLCALPERLGRRMRRPYKRGVAVK